ncbi:hypothetical protein [Sulfitobacter sp. JB4-11]|uniref:hypothetical protein n=1 Tax=Sulfitobacter rhodophyticola TaxID=3238304 RepID=UPI0035186AB6
MTKRLHHIFFGTILSLAVVLGTAMLSSRPAWQSLPADHALLRLSFTQSGVRDCRDRTEAELAALPQNMRHDQLCARRRAPVYVELDLNGEAVFAQNLPPTGLSGTGPSRVYKRFVLPAGSYDVTVRLRDDPAAQDFTSIETQQLSLEPGQSFAIDYRKDAGGFVFN